MSSSLARPGSTRLVFLGTFLIALLFAAYAQHAWEDYYITFRSSKNLVLGHGLVFTPGERVHSFTSPLGVLLPALASALTGGSSDQAALWLFRLMGAGALAGAATLLFHGALRLGSGRSAAWLTVGFLALEAKAVDFSTNGMETGFLLFFIAYTFWALVPREKDRSRHLGVAWAGIMWTRPDGFIYIGLLAAGYWLFNLFAQDRQDRWAATLLLLKAGLVCTLLYLPWFVWAWTYYGSPVPHTIIAKGSMDTGKTAVGYLKTFVQLPYRLWTGQTTVEGALMPTYYQAAGWSGLFTWTARVLGAVATLAWCWPGLKPQTRAASLAFHGAHAYLTYFPYFPFPWYFPATGILGAIVWGGVAGHLLGRAPRHLGRGLVLAAAAWVLLLETTLLLASARQMKAKQEIVYTGNLRRIGEWLHAHAQPTDHVFMEPLGYIGYFSQLPTDDYPGLSSPRMVAARKAGGNGWANLLLNLESEWLVARPDEARRINEESPEVLGKLYEPVQVFDVTRAAAAAAVPDPFMLNFDAYFTLYRRKQPRARDDLILGIQHQFGTDAPHTAIAGTRVRLVHASGTMSLRVPPDTRHFEIKYGFLPDAYLTEPKTDGATFSVVWTDGPVRLVLATRTLDPVNRPEERGLLTFSGEIPPSSSGQARLMLHTSPGASSTKDWTCWGNCTFR